MNFCTVPGCGEPHHARGYCTDHYQELRRGPMLRSKDLALVPISPAWQNALAQLIRELPGKEKHCA